MEQFLSQVIVLVLGYIRQIQVLSKSHVLRITVYHTFPVVGQLLPPSLAHSSQLDTASSAPAMTLQMLLPHGYRMVGVPVELSNNLSGKSKSPFPFLPPPFQ